jgi:hypothetical protein
MILVTRFYPQSQRKNYEISRHGGAGKISTLNSGVSATMRLATITQVSISFTPTTKHYLIRATTASFHIQLIMSYLPYILTYFRLSHLLPFYLNHKCNIYVPDTAHLTVCTISRLAICTRYRTPDRLHDLSSRYMYQIPHT